MHKDTDLEFYFGWLVDELKTKQVSCERTILLLLYTVKRLNNVELFMGQSNVC